MNGPKAIGGVYTIVTNRSVLSIHGLGAIVKVVTQKGYVPSMYGDEHAHAAPGGL